jgi:hypothetical protein
MTTGVACPLVIPQFFNNLGEPAVGGSVLTQVGGINAATYQDSGLTTALPNPIPLNSRGEVSNAIGASCQLFLTPNTVYTFTLYDANGNQLWVATYVNGVQVILSQATIGALLYPQTAAEIAAGVTPSAYQYYYGNVLRYGADPTGTNDSSAAFTNAGQVAMVYGGEVYIPAPSNYYLLQHNINWAQSPTQTYVGGFNVRMDGNPHSGLNSPQGTIHAKHIDVAVFDLTGNNAVQFYDLCVTTDTATYPQTCFLSARNSSGASLKLRYQNCRVYGSFSVAVYYDYGSEDDILIGCDFENYSTNTNTGPAGEAPAVCVWTSHNISGLTSPNVTIATGAQSCLHHHVIGGDYAYQGDVVTSGAAIFYLEEISFLKIDHPWTAANNGGSIVYVDPTNGASSNISLVDIEVENGAAPTYGVLFGEPASGQSPTNWLIDSCYFAGVTSPLTTSVNTTCDSFRIRNISGGADGISVGGPLSYCTFDTDAVELSLGAVSNCVFIGARNNWNFNGTITACKIVDTSAASSRTWTPSAGSFTGTGVGFADTEYTTDGTRCTVTFDVSASGGNLAYTAGTAITGLPFPATRTPGLVSVYDFTGTTYIGSGWVDGNGLHLANSITSTAHVFFIEAQYFVG